MLARRWSGELRKGDIDVTELAPRLQRSPSYVTRIVRLAFLSRAVTRAILRGQQRNGVDVATLTLKDPVPVLWGSSEGAAADWVRVTASRAAPATR